MQFIRAFFIALLLSFFTKRFTRYVLAAFVIYLAILAVVWVTYLVRNKKMPEAEEKKFTELVNDAHLTSDQQQDLDWFTTADKQKVLAQGVALTTVLAAVHQRHAIFNALTWLERQANFSSRKSKSHDHSDANSSLTWYDISDHDDIDSGGSDFGGFGGSSGGGGSDGSW